MRTRMSVAGLVTSLGEQASPLPCNALAGCLFQWHFEHLKGKVVYPHFCLMSLYHAGTVLCIRSIESLWLLITLWIKMEVQLICWLLLATQKLEEETKQPLFEISSIYWEDILDILGALRQCCTCYRVIGTLWPFHLEVKCLTPWAWTIIKSPLSGLDPWFSLGDDWCENFSLHGSWAGPWSTEGWALDGLDSEWYPWVGKKNAVRNAGVHHPMSVHFNASVRANFRQLSKHY